MQRGEVRSTRPSSRLPHPQRRLHNSGAGDRHRLSGTVDPAVRYSKSPMWARCRRSLISTRRIFGRMPSVLPGTRSTGGPTKQRDDRPWGFAPPARPWPRPALAPRLRDSSAIRTFVKETMTRTRAFSIYIGDRPRRGPFRSLFRCLSPTCSRPSARVAKPLSPRVAKLPAWRAGRSRLRIFAPAGCGLRASVGQNIEAV